jgi:hypothetical protein
MVVYQALTNLGWVQLCLGGREEAATLFDEAHEVAQQLGHTHGVAVALVNMGWIALYAGEMMEAANLAEKGLRLCHLLGEREVLAEALEILAATAVATGNPQRAAQLGGAAEVIRQALHVTRLPIQHDAISFTRTVTTVSGQLTAAEFAATWERGRTMNLNAVAAFALHCQ